MSVQHQRNYGGGVSVSLDLGHPVLERDRLIQLNLHFDDVCDGDAVQ